MDQSKFAYQPLDDVSTSLRLIEVLPPSPGSTIRIHMRQERIPAKYCCLSYMWGDASREAEIVMNDQPVRVRGNLHDFLRTAQRRYAGKAFWIDALCINQKDHIERNHQVQRMGDIYKGAESVYIWLGAEPELDPLFEFVDSCQFGFGTSYKVFGLHDGVQSTSWLSSIVEKRLDGSCEQEAKSLARQIQQISRNPYWKRTWIVQEILLARKLFVVNALKTVKWDTLNVFLRTARWSRVAFHLDDEYPMIESFDDLNQNVSQEKSVLFDLFVRLAPSECMDERDRIYSLLSLVQGGESFAVNYEEDVCSLFWRAGEYFGAWTHTDAIFHLSQTLGLTSQLLQADLDSRTSRTYPTLTRVVQNVHLPVSSQHSDLVRDPDVAQVALMDSSEGHFEPLKKTLLHDLPVCPEPECTFFCDWNNKDDILISIVGMAGFFDHAHVRLSPGTPYKDGRPATFWPQEGPRSLSHRDEGVAYTISSTYEGGGEFQIQAGDRIPIPAELILTHLEWIKSLNEQSE